MQAILHLDSAQRKLGFPSGRVFPGSAATGESAVVQHKFSAGQSISDLRESGAKPPTILSGTRPFRWHRVIEPRKLALWALCALVLPATCESESVVAPNAYAKAPGEGAQLPFLEGARYQTVLHREEFLTAMPEGALITGISMRLDETVKSGVKGTIPDVEVRMGTTPSLAPVLTFEFSKNIGSDYRTVFARAPVDYSASPGAGAVNPFGVSIRFSSPFYYDPKQGSLVIDLFSFRESTTTLYLDTGGSFGISGAIDRPQGDIQGALITQLSFIPIPEPSTVTLLFIGALVLRFWRFLR